MGRKYYSVHDWKRDSLVVGPSPIHGRGSFASSFIGTGEIVWVFGGTLFTMEDADAGRADKRTLLQVEEGLWLGNRAGEPESDDYFLNHSCDPSLWLQDEVTLVARGDIIPGEEVTMDYATHFADPGWTMRNACNCGSILCRRTITGKDWMLKNLQERYHGHFSPLLNRRISGLK